MKGSIAPLFRLLSNNIPKKDKIAIFQSFTLQLFLAFADLLGVLLSSVLVLVLSQKVFNSQNSHLSVPHFVANYLAGQNIRNVCITIVVILVLKDLVSIRSIAVHYNKLSKITSELSKISIATLQKLTWIEIRKLQKENINYALNEGINALVIGILGASILLLAEMIMIFMIIFI